MLHTNILLAPKNQGFVILIKYAVIADQRKGHIIDNRWIVVNFNSLRNRGQKTAGICVNNDMLIHQVRLALSPFAASFRILSSLSAEKLMLFLIYIFNRIA